MTENKLSPERIAELNRSINEQEFSLKYAAEFERSKLEFMLQQTRIEKEADLEEYMKPKDTKNNSAPLPPRPKSLIDIIVKKTKSQAAKMGWFVPLVPLVLCAGVALIYTTLGLQGGNPGALEIAGCIWLFVIIGFYTY